MEVIDNIKDNGKKPLIEELEELRKYKNESESNSRKVKKVKMPRKARVKKSKLKRGYIGIMYVDENKNASFEKQKVSGSSYKDSKGLYHATNGSEIMFMDGKYPFIIQQSWKNNPVNLTQSPTEPNETYGQPYIKAKMLADTIKVKKQGGSIVVWILIGAAVLFGLNYILGGKLFG